MSNTDAPAGTTGGPSALADLPEKLRVHALAKLIGRTSKEVLATLADLGVEIRSAQSSVDRALAERVVTALLPDPDVADETAVADEAYTDAATPEAVPAPASADAPGVAGSPAVSGEPAVAEAPADTDGDGAETGTGTAADAGRAPLFAAPVFQPPAPERRPSRRTRAAAAAPEAADPFKVVDKAPATGPDAGADGGADVRADIDEAETDTTADDAAVADDDAGDDSDEAGARRRRRRGRRGRGRGRGADGADDADDQDDTEGDSTSDSASDDGADSGRAAGADEDAATDDDAEGSDDGDDSESDESGSSRRRRRRRRRRGGSDDADSSEDPPGTVTRVRTPRERSGDDDASDGVQSVRGSTRLEAKRQRRRDGRDAGRRRVPILTEAEFLARRESVDRSMVVREHGDRVEIAVLEDGVLVEHFVADGPASSGSAASSMVGNIHLGRVQNVLPSMEAAFVDIGRGRNAVLYAGEVDWDAAGLNGKARRIEQALSTGDSVLVQVTKDPIGHKGARLTTQISLAGRFLVYVPSGGTAGISRKLPDTERKRLKDMLKEIVPAEAGVIIRTASEGVTQEALERDVRRLQAQWEVVRSKADATGPNKVKAPALLYEEPDLLVKVVRDQFNEDFSRLVVSGDDAWDTVSNYIGHVAPELSDRLHRHVGPTDVFTEYRIDEQLLKALDRKVWLPSGGTLVIDRTEAMTVIDVNTGKFTGSGGNLEETVTRNNLEAAEEIVRQLRLRDIGGIIVIDFIDMVLEANRDLVLRRLTECLARDRTRHQVAEVTSLGLVQMTRKRVGGGLLEHFSTQCEHCRGRGVIVSTEGVEAKGEHKQGGDRQHERDGKRGRNRNRRDDNGRHTEHDDKPQLPPDAGIAVVAAQMAADQPGKEKAEPPVLRLAGSDDPDGAPVPAAPAASADPGAEPAAAEPAAAESAAAESAAAESAAVESAAAEPGAAEPGAAAEPAASAEAEASPGRTRTRRTRARRAAAPPEPRSDAPSVDPALAGAGAAEAAVSESAPATTDDTPATVSGSGERNGTPEPVRNGVPAAAVADTSARNGHEAHEAAAAAVPGGPLNGGPLNGSVPTAGVPDPGVPDGSVPEGSGPEDAIGDDGDAGRPRRRRGRVTRTAGSPSGATAAVITAPVPAAETAAPEAVPAVAAATVPPQPEPVTEARPRRQRRTASRPAGPPAGAEE